MCRLNIIYLSMHSGINNKQQQKKQTCFFISFLCKFLMSTVLLLVKNANKTLRNKNRFKCKVSKNTKDYEDSLQKTSGSFKLCMHPVRW